MSEQNPETPRNMVWQVLQSEQIIDRPWLQARKDVVKLPNGTIHNEYYVLSYPTWVNVIAETTDGKLILERQYRHALGIVSTEICAGVVEKDEEPLHAAQRELLEETGFGGGTWQHFMTMAPNPGSMNNVCHSFLAQGVSRRSNRHLDATEDIDVLLLNKAQVWQMLQQGQFMQALMVAPLWKYFHLYPVQP